MSNDEDPPLGTRTETTTLALSSHTLRAEDLKDLLLAWTDKIGGDLSEVSATARTLPSGEVEVTLRRVRSIAP